MTVYNKKLRNKKVLNMIIQLMGINMDWILDNHVKYIIQYINEGIDYKTIIEMPEYSCELDILLSNDRNIQSYMNLKRKRFHCEDKNIEEMNTKGLRNLQNIMDGKEIPEKYITCNDNELD